MGELVKRYVKMVDDSMKDHVVRDGHTETEMVFRKPKSSDWLIRYTIVGRTHLVVTGDLGAAVYTWSSDISFAWLGRLNMDYMMGKCEASEWGRRPREWDMGAARAGLAWYLSQTDRKRRHQWLKLRQEDSYAIEGALDSSDGWASFVDSELREIWEDPDGIFDIGWIFPIRAVAHWRGLQLAQARLSVPNA